MQLCGIVAGASVWHLVRITNHLRNHIKRRLSFKHKFLKVMAKKDYYDDPEEYWAEKEDRKERDGTEKRERWEKENPNHVYGHPTPKQI